MTENAPRFGRLLRFLLGGLLVVEAIVLLSGAGRGLILPVLGTTVGLIALYSLIHFVVSAFLAAFNRWMGAILALVPVLVVFVLGGTPGEVGALAFLGTSLVLASVRGDPGCEVMSVPAVFFGKRTHLVCLFFSPIDWAEKRLLGPG